MGIQFKFYYIFHTLKHNQSNKKKRAFQCLILFPGIILLD